MLQRAGLQACDPLLEQWHKNLEKKIGSERQVASPVPAEDQIVDMLLVALVDKALIRRQGRKVDRTIRDDKLPIEVDVALHPQVRAGTENDGAVEPHDIVEVRRPVRLWCAGPQEL